MARVAATRHVPINADQASKLSTKPVFCLSAMPNNTFIVRHVWIAASP